MTRLKRDVVVGGRMVAVVAVELLPRPAEAADLQLLKTLRFDILTSARAGGADDLARLGSDLNRMAVALETQEGMRRRWLANVAHELRTPLTVGHH